MIIHYMFCFYLNYQGPNNTKWYIYPKKGNINAMYNWSIEGICDTTEWRMLQDRWTCSWHATGKTPRGPRYLGQKFWRLPFTTSITDPCRPDIGHSDRGFTAPLSGRQNGGHQLDHPAALAASFRGGERRYMIDCRGACGVAGKRADPMGRILRAHARPLGWPRKSPRSEACGSGRNLAENYGEVCFEGGGSGGKGGLWDGTTLQKGGGGHRRGHHHDAPPVEATCTEGGLDVLPHWCTKRVQLGESDGNDVSRTIWVS